MYTALITEHFLSSSNPLSILSILDVRVRVRGRVRVRCLSGSGLLSILPILLAGSLSSSIKRFGVPVKRLPSVSGHDLWWQQ
jgi:hypothetical protein